LEARRRSRRCRAPGVFGKKAVVRKVEAALARFFLERRRLPALAVCRILFGSSLFFHYLGLFSRRQEGFGPDGFFGNRFYSRVRGFPGLSAFQATQLVSHRVANFQWMHQISNPSVITVLFALLLASAAAFVVGFKTRAAGALLLFLHFLFFAQNEL